MENVMEYISQILEKQGIPTLLILAFLYGGWKLLNDHYLPMSKEDKIIERDMKERDTQIKEQMSRSIELLSHNFAEHDKVADNLQNQVDDLSTKIETISEDLIEFMEANDLQDDQIQEIKSDISNILDGVHTASKSLDRVVKFIGRQSNEEVQDE